MANGKCQQKYKFETGKKVTRKTENTKEDDRQQKDPKYYLRIEEKEIGLLRKIDTWNKWNSQCLLMKPDS